jgi:uncharacterized repeat protein (TIGR02543 family)
MIQIHKTWVVGSADAPKVGNATLYTVRFNANGGVGAPPAQYVLSSTKQPETTPVREGYTFAGWVTPDGEAWDFASPVTGNLRLEASWSKDESDDEELPVEVDKVWTVQFLNGDGSAFAPAQTVPDGGRATRPTKNPVDSNGHFNFLFWAKCRSHTVTQLEVYDFSAPVHEDINLCGAFWE